MTSRNLAPPSRAAGSLFAAYYSAGRLFGGGQETLLAVRMPRSMAERWARYQRV
jgi:hypothetical protein